MKKKIILYVKNKEFCDWFFSKKLDNDDFEDAFCDVISTLRKGNKVVLSVEHFLKGIISIPINLIHNSEDILNGDKCKCKSIHNLKGYELKIDNVVEAL